MNKQVYLDARKNALALARACRRDAAIYPKHRDELLSEAVRHETRAQAYADCVAGIATITTRNGASHVSA